MATKQTRSNPFMSESTSQLPDSMPVYSDQTGGGVNIAPGNRQKQSQVSSQPPSFFDFFYEEFLTNVMNTCVSTLFCHNSYHFLPFHLLNSYD